MKRQAVVYDRLPSRVMNRVNRRDQKRLRCVMKAKSKRGKKNE